MDGTMCGNGFSDILRVQGSVAFRLAKGLGKKTGQQRHRDKDKCRHRYGKIGRFCCYIAKNIAHSHSPTIAA
jgi:hypothetical protein